MVVSRLLLVIALLLIATVAHAAPWTTQLEAPPTMASGYLHIKDKCPNEAGWPTAAQMENKDVKIEFPTNRKCTNSSNLTRIGGNQGKPARNIWIVGGHLERTGLSFQRYSGTVFVEGTVIDMKGICQDAFNGYHGEGTAPRWVFQNVHATGVNYCDGGTHGDFIHPQGTGTILAELKVQNAFVHVTTQGIFSPPRRNGTYPGHGAEKITLENMYMAADPVNTRKIASFVYFGESPWGPPLNGISFKKVYFKWWGGASNMGTGNFAMIYPRESGWTSAGCMTFPASAKVTSGAPCKGEPPDGNPAPLNMIGLNYKRSNFTTDAPPPDPPPTDPPPTDPPPVTPSSGTDNRLFVKAGHARLGAVLAQRFLTGSSGQQIVAYSYREHNKSAAAGSADLCKAGGINWPVDTADVIYVTSELNEPADLDVTVGTSAAVKLSLPANQASSGLQSTVPIDSKVGEVKFVLSRNGATIKQWSGKLQITGAPAIRTVSTYSDAEIITGTAEAPKFWVEPVSLDKAEGNSGDTEFTFRVSRNTTADSASVVCTVSGDTATASDFSSGVLPSTGTVSFAVGVSDVVVGKMVKGDTDQESDETFFVQCDTPSPSTYTIASNNKLTATIRNDDAPSGAPRFSLRVIDGAVVEGTGSTPTTQRFEITRLGDVTGRTDTVDFCPQPNQTGINSAASNDFVGGWQPRGVTFAPGDSIAKQIDMSIVADNVPEPNETYDVMLRYPSSGALIENGTVTASILNDDGSGNATGARVNAGQTAEEPYIDSAGNAWSKDTGTGGAVDTNQFTFSGTSDQQLWRTHRYGASTYVFNVEPGFYVVNGLFSEHDEANNGVNCEASKGKRLITTKVTATGGDTVARPDIDPYCESGFRAAHIVELAKVNAPQGKVTVEIRGGTGSTSVPLVNGLTVESSQQNVVARTADWLNLGATEGTTYTDSAGNNWRVPEASLLTGCTSQFDTAMPDIASTGDDPLYWSRCVGSDINISVPVDTSNGSDQRSLNLLFSEPTAGAGARVFDVYVNGTKQLSGVDIAQLSGGVKTALTRSISPVTVPSNGRVAVRLVSTTSNAAIVNGLSITNVQTDKTYQAKIGWRGKLRLSKRDLVKAVNSTGLSASGNPLVIRKLNTTGSDVYACHGPCDSTATKGLQPDTEASKQKLYIEVMAHAPSDPTTSVWPTLKPGKNAETSFTAAVAELLSDGTTGAESTVTVTVIGTRAM